MDDMGMGGMAGMDHGSMAGMGGGDIRHGWHGSQQDGGMDQVT
jgi:hypothetical protein